MTQGPTKGIIRVSSTILEQLGGQRFITMTGATGFTGSARDLTFRLPRNVTRHRANAMRITLEASDTYRIELIKTVKLDCLTVDDRSGVHADQLRSVFTDMTGLETSLGTQGRERVEAA